MNKGEFLKLTEDYDHVIFDFGGIFININYQKTIDEMNRIGNNNKASDLYGQHAQISIFSDLEIGKISEFQFLSKLNNLLELDNKESELKLAWNSMLFDIPNERIDFLKELKKDKKLYLLSNINQIHEKHISTLDNAEEFYSQFDKIYFSHHLGMRKPDSEIFNHVLSDLEIKASEAFFIDDSIGHVNAAKGLGIQAVLLEKQNGFLTSNL
jgi:putative hydrolase of the HAD superfamily